MVNNGLTHSVRLLNSLVIQCSSLQLLSSNGLICSSVRLDVFLSSNKVITGQTTYFRWTSGNMNLFRYEEQDLDCRSLWRNMSCRLPFILSRYWCYVAHVPPRVDMVVHPNAIFFDHFRLWRNTKNVDSKTTRRMGWRRNLLLDCHFCDTCHTHVTLV